LLLHLLVDLLFYALFDLLADLLFDLCLGRLRHRLLDDPLVYRHLLPDPE
jgi:hypothetical protein